MNKFFARTKLARILDEIRGKKRIVFTNGCFDILHVGHVRLLAKAKKCGDVLVVAVNSDSSVRQLKGQKRPLVPEKLRVELLSALSAVDYITLFSESTPLKTIQMFRPHILIKGGDYSYNEIVGRKDVEKVVRFPLVKGFSTTTLIQKILKCYGK